MTATLNTDGTAADSPVVPSVSVTNLMALRAGVMDRFEQILGLLAEARELALAGKFECPQLMLGGRGYRYGDFILDPGRERAACTEALRLVIDRSAWAYLLHESGLRTFMDSKARKEWDEKCYSGAVPALTPDNVEATFGLMHENREDMFERGVVRCFRNLSWHYKTNLPQAFGRRIILTHLLSYGYLRHEVCDTLDDLVRVFHIIDGRPEPDHRHGMWSLLAPAWRGNQGVLETEYLHIRMFRNGNGHVTFLRPELVDRLNAIVAKHHPNVLPPPEGGWRKRGR